MFLKALTVWSKGDKTATHVVSTVMFGGCILDDAVVAAMIFVYINKAPIDIFEFDSIYINPNNILTKMRVRKRNKNILCCFVYWFFPHSFYLCT